jgi:hypothetical protein
MKETDEQTLMDFVAVALRDPDNFDEYPDFVYCGTVYCKECPLEKKNTKGKSECIIFRTHLPSNLLSCIETKYPEVLL